MKKQYIKPEMEIVVMASSQQMLAGSDALPLVDSEVMEGLSRDFDY